MRVDLDLSSYFFAPKINLLQFNDIFFDPRTLPEVSPNITKDTSFFSKKPITFRVVIRGVLTQWKGCENVTIGGHSQY